MQIYKNTIINTKGSQRYQAFYIDPKTRSRTILCSSKDVHVVDAFIAGMITYHHEVIQTPLPPVFECGSGYIPIFRHYEAGFIGNWAGTRDGD